MKSDIALADWLADNSKVYIPDIDCKDTFINTVLDEKFIDPDKQIVVNNFIETATKNDPEFFENNTLDEVLESFDWFCELPA